MEKTYEAELWHYGVKGMRWRKGRKTGDDLTPVVINARWSPYHNLHSRERHDNDKEAYARRGSKVSDRGKYKLHSRKRHDSGKSGYAVRQDVVNDPEEFERPLPKRKGSSYSFRRNKGRKKSGTPVFTKIRYSSK